MERTLFDLNRKACGDEELLDPATDVGIFHRLVDFHPDSSHQVKVGCGFIKDVPFRAFNIELQQIDGAIQKRGKTFRGDTNGGGGRLLHAPAGH